MRTTRSAIAGIMATVVLVAALAVPALAVAAPTSGATVRTAAVSTTPGRGMIARYRALANAHRIIFRAQVRTLSRRLDRLSFIATLAARAGGDVTGIRASIASERSIPTKRPAPSSRSDIAASARPVPHPISSI